MLRHFEIAREFGFRTLEFGIGGGQTGRLPSDLDDAGAAAFRALAARHDIATPGCCLENDFTLPTPAGHDVMLRQTLHQIRLAERCGATQVRLFAGFTPAAAMDEATWTRMMDAFRQADELCRQLGLTIAVETHGRIAVVDGAAHHEHTVTTEPAALRRLLRELPPRVGINWDPGNLKAVAPGDRLCALPLINGRINYCHLKDWRRQNGGWIACAIGDDDLDYRPLLRGVRFAGVFHIEYEPTHDPEDGIRRSLAYLRSLGLELELV